MPIQNAPVDQAAFTRMMLVAIDPKTDRDTGAQYTTRDGAERKWSVQVVASLPSRFDPARSDSEVLSVTVTCADDPRTALAEGVPVQFDGLAVGVMPPEKNEDTGRIRGGKLFWTATGIGAGANGSKRSADA